METIRDIRLATVKTSAIVAEAPRWALLSLWPENRNRWGLLDKEIVTILEAWVKKDPVYNLSSNKTEHINQ